MAHEEEDIREQLKAAQRLNEELRRLEAGGGDDELVFEKAYKVGASRPGRSTSNPHQRPAEKVKRTFTAAPKTHQAKKHTPTHYTFNSTRVTEIERENEVLAEKLARVVTRPSAGPLSETAEVTLPPHLRVASVAPSTINRKKKNDKIAKENAALLQRLQAIQPSKQLKACMTTTSRPISGAKPKAPTMPVRYRPEWQD